MCGYVSRCNPLDTPKRKEKKCKESGLLPTGTGKPRHNLHNISTKMPRTCISNVRRVFSFKSSQQRPSAKERTKLSSVINSYGCFKPFKCKRRANDTSRTTAKPLSQIILQAHWLQHDSLPARFVLVWALSFVYPKCTTSSLSEWPIWPAHGLGCAFI